MALTCPQCNTTISTENTQLITCPACNTLFQVELNRPAAGLLWPEFVLPKGIAVESSADALRVTYRSFGIQHIVMAVIGLIIGVILFFDANSFTALLAYLACPASWISIGLVYYALTGLLNSTTIRAAPNELRVAQGPLPLWGYKRQLLPQNIEQLYIKEKEHKDKNRTHFTYEVHVQRKYGRDKMLVKGLATSLHALYLEQELEHYLGLEDRPVSGEFSRPPRQSQQLVWQTLAEANHLTFSAGKLIEAMYMTGPYYGHKLTMTIVRKHYQRDGSLHTRLVMSTDTLKAPEQYPPLKDIVWIMNRLNQQFAQKKETRIEGSGLKIEYEQAGVETTAKYVQALFNSFRYLLDAYPYMQELGGEAIEALRPIATDNQHALQSVAKQWIEDIAAHTRRLQHQTKLLCQLCLIHVAPREVELSRMNFVTYFGCPECHQSRDFYTPEAVVAVLNNTMDVNVFEQDGVLRVNWFTHKELFDFDMVEIVNATDEEVERFAVRVGNDTNPARIERYKHMHCYVWRGCNLSKNSMRILEHTFGMVKIKSTAVSK